MNFRSIFKIWLLSRLWLSGFTYLGHFMHSSKERLDDTYAGVSNWWLNPWTTYDSQFYIDIAQHGYRPFTSAFFPLYPLSMRPFGPSENTMALAGVVISNLALLGALLLLYHLSRLTMSDTMALQSVWILAFFPAAVHSMAVYTESLFLFLTLATFYAARTQRWIWVAPLGILAALTRNAGLVIMLALCVEWFAQHRSDRKPPLWALAPAFAPALAFAGMQFYLRSEFGAAVTSVSAQQNFGRLLSLPWVPVWKDLLALVQEPNLSLVLNVLASVLVFVFGWKYRHRLPAADNVFMGGVMLMQLCLPSSHVPHTAASLRYVFATWPFSQSLAFEGESKKWPPLRLILITVGLALSAIISFLFGKKWFFS